MFLGIFSSIIPYLIAGGFYLAWLLFSLVQPLLFQKKAPESSNDPLPGITAEESIQKVKSEENYYYEDYTQDINQPLVNDACIQYKLHFCPEFLPVLHPPQKEKLFRDYFILSGYFSRPPPSC